MKDRNGSSVIEKHSALANVRLSLIFSMIGSATVLRYD